MSNNTHETEQVVEGGGSLGNGTTSSSTAGASSPSHFVQLVDGEGKFRLVFSRLVR